MIHTLFTATLIFERAAAEEQEDAQVVWMRASRMAAFALRYKRAAVPLYLATDMRAMATAGTSTSVSYTHLRAPRD